MPSTGAGEAADTSLEFCVCCGGLGHDSLLAYILWGIFKAVSSISVKDLWCKSHGKEDPNLFIQVIKGTVETGVGTQGMKLIIHISRASKQE